MEMLKAKGFKTFDKWWDESYDEEIDLELRIQKIVKILEEIAKFCYTKELLFELQYIKEESNKVETKEDMIIVFWFNSRLKALISVCN